MHPAATYTGLHLPQSSHYPKIRSNPNCMYGNKKTSGAKRKVDNTPHKSITITAPKYSKQKRIAKSQLGNKHENYFMV
jgi:hypothetical protein